MLPASDLSHTTPFQDHFIDDALRDTRTVLLIPFREIYKYTVSTLSSDPPQPVLTTIHLSRARAASEHNYPTAARLPCEVVFPCCTAWYKNSAEAEQNSMGIKRQHALGCQGNRYTTLQYSILTSSRHPAMQVIYFNVRPLARSVYISVIGVRDTSGEKVGCLPCVM
jgi:hypothetical protein